jgi:hypothetical protein
MILVLTIRLWPRWLVRWLWLLGGMGFTIERVTGPNTKVVVAPRSILRNPDGLSVAFEVGKVEWEPMDMEP